MKKTKIILLVTAIALLLGAIIGIAASATEPAPKPEIIGKNIRYGADLKFRIAVDGDTLGAGKTVTVNMSASDFCEILKDVFNSDDFVFHGITGKCEGNNKSDISWSASGFVNKQADKYVVKEANS